MATLQEVRQLAESSGVRRVDLRATDLLGRWQHVTVPLSQFTAQLIERGVGGDVGAFEGSGTRGIELAFIPDLDTAVVDPATGIPTLSVICRLVERATGDRFARDPRHVAEKAEAHLRASGVADSAHFGTRLQFFVFDDVRYQQASHSAFYFVDAEEGAWNTGRDETPNLGAKVAAGQGYLQAPPFDAQADLRWALCEALTAIGAVVESERREAASAGQAEIAVREQPLVRKADEIQWYKYLARNVARAHGKVATFMPKPIYGEPGSGMRTHQSLWRAQTPTFFDSNGYAGLSQTARYYIGGLLRHAPALLAFCSPTTSSFRRLTPEESPVHLTYSVRSPSAVVRVPEAQPSPPRTRVEFRPPDGSANPYLALSAMLMAGLDGVESRIEPGDPLEKNVHDLTAAELGRVQRLPASLEASLDALAADHAFLRKGDVFSQELIDRWIEVKRDEAREVAARPTPHEYELYFSV
ncbi:MAG: type I glutamate--ammonia ligase [Chloroflexi bacterium]|nr:type I glutamate--ammonia ligase [Chloroflexota bacterium]